MKGPSGALSVLIVDDNELVCRSLSESSIWASLPAKVRGTATSSKGAEELIRRFRPDILITDIKMPGSDGLELADYARREVPECRVIFITAYDEFELAQRAVRLDAADFILKPIRDQEVERAVRKIASQLIDLRERGRETELLRSRYGEIEEQLKVVELQAREKLVSDLLHGTLAGKLDARDRMRALGMKLGRYQVLVAVGAGGRRFDRRSPSELTTQFERPSTAAQWSEVASLLAVVIEGRAAVVVDINEACGESRRTVITLEVAKLVASAASRQGGRQEEAPPSSPESPAERIVVGVSGVHTEPHTLRQAYEEGVLAAEQDFFDPGKDLRFYAELAPQATFREDRFNRLRELLKSALAERTMAESEESPGLLIDELVGELRKAGHLGRAYAENKLRLLAETLTTGHRTEGRLRDLASLGPGVSSFQSLDEARLALHGALRAVMDARLLAARPLQHHHVGLAVEFLESNFSEPIRLADVARAVGVSPSHLSRLIRKTTGQTFTELLTSIRLKAAERLLRQTNAKVYQIADMVGMKNHAYFYQLFRRHTGMSPNEAR